MGLSTRRAVHAADAARVERARTFDAGATLDGDFEIIPIPGHTPGATAFLWERGGCSPATVCPTGEWIAAVLGDSDRAAYIEMLERLRELEFDVVPWAAEGDGWCARRPGQLDAILTRLRNGEDR